MVNEELQRLEARVLARGNTAELLNSIVREVGAFTIVHFVVTEAGQFCSHRQPSLACTKRCFRPLGFGDVDGEAQQAIRLTGGLEGRPPAGRDPSLATIAKPDPIFQVQGFTRLQGPIEAPLNEIPIVGMNGCLETRHADDFPGKIPKECPSLIGDPKDLRLVIQLPEPQPRRRLPPGSAARCSRASPGRRVSEPAH